jgi:hypothetical protein
MLLKHTFLIFDNFKSDTQINLARMHRVLMKECTVYVTVNKF